MFGSFLQKCKHAIRILAVILIMIVGIISYLEFNLHQKINTEINYSFENIERVLNKNELTDEDYKLLFYQTGLGRLAIDQILETGDGVEDILRFQRNFHSNPIIIKERSDFTTGHYSSDDNGNKRYGFELAPYDDGYVVLSFSSHTLGWMHGHAGIIVNSDRGEVLEAFTLGETSDIRSIETWRYRPNFIMLRLKAPKETLDQISQFAFEEMIDLPYSLTVGLTSPKNPKKESLIGTQCSHLVWYPFKQFGYDIDSDGSWLVTPRDIANSDLFEIVQVYGIDPRELL